jgi:hemoglobin/transferrin/lactoferrin receptor protein
MKYLFILLSIPVLGFSQSNNNLGDSAFLKEVIVTATRQKTNAINLPFSVNRISANEIQSAGFRTAPESLTGNTGIFVQKTNHGGGSPFVRALTGNQNLLLLDGIRLNNSTYRYGPNQYFNTIDVYSIASIEVVRGTGSVQYGSDAMGGVIQVFSKAANFNTNNSWSGSVLGKMVSGNMEYTGRAEIEYSSKNFAFHIGGSSRNFGDLIGGDTTGVQSPSGYKEQAYDFQAKWKLKNETIITVASQQLIQKDVPLYHRVKLENFAYYNFAPQVRGLHYAKIEFPGKSPLFSKASFTASFQQTKEIRSYFKNGATNKFEETDKVKTLGLTAELDSKFSKNWTAISGIEWYHDQVKSNKQQIGISNGTVSMQRGLYPDNASSANFSVYSLHQLNLQRFQINAGLRYNSFAIKIKDTAAGANQLGEVTVKPSSLVANVSLLYHLSDNQSLYSSFSTGYRTPNIDDMGTLGLVDFRYEVPAYGLKPEKSYNTELGYRLQGKRFKSSLALFYMQLNDLVTRVQLPGQQISGYNVYIKENSQESFVRGFEMEMAYQLSKNWLLKGGFSQIYGQNTSRNEPMRRVPPMNGQIQLKYHYKTWTASIENLFATKQDRLAQGDKDDNRIPFGGTPGWNLWNIYAGYGIGKVQINTALINVFNVDYRMHGSGINGAGRNICLSLNYQF